MKAAPSSAPKWIKSLACLAHRAANLTTSTARLHLSLCRWLAGRISPFRRRQLLNSLGQVRWPAGALQPAAVPERAEIAF